MPASAAYVEAGYTPSTANAHRLSKKDSIRNRVDSLRAQKAAFVSEAIQETGITVARTIEELAKIGFSDLRQAFTEGGTLLPPQDWPDSLAGAIASVKVVTRSLGRGENDGNPGVEYITELRFWPKVEALGKISQYLQMFVEAKDSETAQQQLRDLMKIIVSPNSALPVNAGRHRRLVTNALDTIEE